MRLSYEIDVLPHQITQGNSDGGDGSTMSAHISEQHSGDPSGSAGRQVVHISATNAVPKRLAVDPQIKTWN